MAERAIPADVEHDVVAFIAAGEILHPVVDDFVCADRADEIHAFGAGHGRDRRPQPPGDLHREGSHAASSPIDQDSLACLDPRFVAETLQRGQARDVESGRLLGRQRRGLRGQPVFSGRRVFREAAVAPSEDLVPRLEPRDLLPHGDHSAGKVDAADAILGCTESTDADEVRRASRDVTVQGVDRRGVHLHEQALVSDARRGDLAKPENVRRAVPFLDDCLHGTISGVVRMRVEDAPNRPGRADGSRLQTAAASRGYYEAS
jgi:hypothetical protein